MKTKYFLKINKFQTNKSEFKKIALQTIFIVPLYAILKYIEF